ncbi:MAG: hypothetical protein P4L83_21330 [Nevskia sp.]|nr:hypothetical protein [Nevskia sp.]
MRLTGVLALILVVALLEDRVITAFHHSPAATWIAYGAGALIVLLAVAYLRLRERRQRLREKERDAGGV